MSGHAKVITDGWIRNFYIPKDFYNDEAYYEDYVQKYPSHFNCLAYSNEDDPNNILYYYYTCGLSSSRIVDGYLYSEYHITLSNGSSRKQTYI